MTTPVDIRISPALDPETYRSVEGYDDSNRGYVDDVISVFDDTYHTLGKLHEARRQAEKNPAWTPANRVLILSKEALKQKERLAKRLDRAVGDLGRRIEHIEGELARPLEARALGTLNAEIRSHSKSLSRDDREKLIQDAMREDDDTTLASILAAPPYLSGLTSVDQSHYLGVYHARKNPALVARLNLMRRVQDTMNATGANGGVFHTAFEKVVGAKPSEVRAIEQADAAARAALNVEP